jgi:hypothetical protein
LTGLSPSNSSRQSRGTGLRSSVSLIPVPSRALGKLLNAEPAQPRADRAEGRPEGQACQEEATKAPAAGVNGKGHVNGLERHLRRTPEVETRRRPE